MLREYLLKVLTMGAGGWGGGMFPFLQLWHWDFQEAIFLLNYTKFKFNACTRCCDWLTWITFGIEQPRTITDEPYLPILNYSTVNPLYYLKSKYGRGITIGEIRAIIETKNLIHRDVETMYKTRSTYSIYSMIEDRISRG